MDQEKPIDSSKSRRVTVRFVDVGTGSVISRSRIAVADLPPVILPHQTIVLSDTSWRVAKADPPTLLDEDDTLTLLVQDPQPQAIPDEPFWVDYPTRSASVPPLEPGTTKAGKHVLALYEEDWRQVEFVAASQHAVVEETMAKVRRICLTEKVKRGYRQSHIRTELPEPLYGINIGTSEVEELFGEGAAAYEGICFERFAALISGGFGVATETGIRLYGLQSDGLVKALCLAETYPVGDFKEHVGALLKFAQVHDLLLVDWLQTLCLSPTLDNYRRYFG